MLFENNSKPRKKSYYPFSKNYPTKSGNSYDIGESRARHKREERNKVIFYISLIVLFVLVFIASSVAITLSRRSITDVNAGKASEYTGKLKAYHMPDEALSGGIAYSLFKTELSNAKANAVMIDFKTADGLLNFNCSYETAVSIGATASAYENANEIITALKNDGYKIIANIYCFEDSLAASMLSGAEVTQAGTGAVWLDNTAQKDGNPRLNPYSQTACDYLLNVIAKSVECGADVVLLSSVSFPDSPTAADAYFEGEEGSVQSRNAVLHEFVSNAAAVCGNVPVAVYLSADSALNGNGTLYSGGMFDSDALFNAVDFRSAAIKESITIGGESFSKEDINENACISKAVPLLKEKLEENYTTKDIIPVIDDEIYLPTLENLQVENYIIIKSDP